MMMYFDILVVMKFFVEEVEFVVLVGELMIIWWCFVVFWLLYVEFYCVVGWYFDVFVYVDFCGVFDVVMLVDIIWGDLFVVVFYVLLRLYDVIYLVIVLCIGVDEIVIYDWELVIVVFVFGFWVFSFV